MRLRLSMLVAEHPRVTLALKTALAVALAWLVVQPMGGAADKYPYYAPLGAVLAVSTTVASSVRGSLHGVLAILLGAGLAVAAQNVPSPEVVRLAVVVCIGVLLARWRHVRTAASWVPVSALFVLIVGRHDTVTYLAGYLGLTAIGALIGVALNLLLPPLPLTPTDATIKRLRRTLAEQLDDLADGLLQEEPLSADEWQRRTRSIDPIARDMRTMVTQATEARRGNWRAGRWQDRADQQYQQARALETLAFMVEDVTMLVTNHERADREHVALGAPLRPYAAHTFEALAAAMRTVEGGCTAREEADDAAAALDLMVTAIRETRTQEEVDLFAAGTVVMAVRRALASMVPEDVEAELMLDQTV